MKRISKEGSVLSSSSICQFDFSFTEITTNNVREGPVMQFLGNVGPPCYTLREFLWTLQRLLGLSSLSANSITETVIVVACCLYRLQLLAVYIYQFYQSYKQTHSLAFQPLKYFWSAFGNVEVSTFIFDTFFILAFYIKHKGSCKKYFLLCKLQRLVFKETQHQPNISKHQWLQVWRWAIQQATLSFPWTVLFDVYLSYYLSFVPRYAIPMSCK